MINITLYKNLSDDKVIGKTLTASKSLTGSLYEPADILGPQVDIKLFSGFEEYNYMYIPAFGRYYFITDMTVVEGNKIRISSHVDVLETYWSKGLSAVKCHVVRQANPNQANFYLIDNKMETTGRHLTQVKTSGPNIDIILPSNTTAYTYILNTM